MKPFLSIGELICLSVKNARNNGTEPNRVRMSVDTYLNYVLETNGVADGEIGGSGNLDVEVSEDCSPNYLLVDRKPYTSGEVVIISSLTRYNLMHIVPNTPDLVGMEA